MRERVSGFATRLVAVSAAGVALRLAYALIVAPEDPVRSDGREFHLLARVLADEGRYLQPFIFLDHGEVVPTAEKPVLYPLLIAVPFKLGFDGYAAQRVTDSLLGALTVAVIGLLGRRVAGDRVGLLAAGIAAAYPMLVVLSGTVRSESLYALLIALALLAAYRLVERPSLGRAAALGGLVGLATLTRSEGIALVLLLVVPTVLLVPAGHRLRLVAVACLASAAVTGIWVARNWTTFDRPALSTNEGGLLAGANCEAAYYSRMIGRWPCVPQHRPEWGRNEAAISARLRRRAFEYMGDHAGRVPVVVGVRVLRLWELYEPREQALIEHRDNGRNLRMQQAGVAVYYVLVALALYGAVVLRRRGQPLRILAAPAVLVTLVAAATYGSTRFRVAAEVPLVVLSAVAAADLWTRRALLGRRRRSMAGAR